MAAADVLRPGEPVVVDEYAWTQPLTVADQMIIQKLDPVTRAAVERYARQGGWHNCSDDADDDDAYEEGWEDAMEEVQDALSMSPPPRGRRRR